MAGDRPNSRHKCFHRHQAAGPESFPSPFGRGAGGEGGSAKGREKLTALERLALTPTLSQRERGPVCQRALTPASHTEQLTPRTPQPKMGILRRLLAAGYRPLMSSYFPDLNWRRLMARLWLEQACRVLGVIVLLAFAVPLWADEEKTDEKASAFLKPSSIVHGDEARLYNNHVTVVLNQSDGTWDATWRRGADATVHRAGLAIGVDGRWLAPQPFAVEETAAVNDAVGLGVEFHRAGARKWRSSVTSACTTAAPPLSSLSKSPTTQTR